MIFKSKFKFFILEIINFISVSFIFLSKILIYFCVFLILIFIRIIRPLILVRIGNLWSFRIGHFAANTELYLCEKDANINSPHKFIFDFFYFEEPISNHQLMLMWKRKLIVLPAWLLIRIKIINKLIPGGHIHEVGNNANNDRDIHNLLDKYPSHLNFIFDEEIKGQEELLKIGLPKDAKFVCLLVRDSEYLASYQPEIDWSAHDYRDSNIENYILAIKELINRGYFVIRMGVKVKHPLSFTNPKFIDYAYNGMRSDFSDIYLGAKCEFCISTGAGWDAVPAWLFRRPVLFTNIGPLGYLPTFSSKFNLILKGHFSIEKNRFLTFSEIFDSGLGYTLDYSDYKMKNVKLIENTPVEILEAVVETEERLSGTWKDSNEDKKLQNQFWEIFKRNLISTTSKAALHGEIKSHFSTTFLRKHKTWLQ